MKGSTVTLISVLVFACTHLILSLPPIRKKLILLLGIKVFLLTYVFLTIASLMLIATSLWFLGHEHAINPLAPETQMFTIVLGTFSFIGAALAMAGLFSYPNSPMAVFSRRSRGSKSAHNVDTRLPKSMDRFTRHPFFVGFAIIMLCHALMASTLPLLIFFAGFALVPIVGMKMQDYKLRQNHGAEYQQYLSNTSIIPSKPDEALPPMQNARASLIKTVLGTLAFAALHPIWVSTNASAFALLSANAGIILVVMQLNRH